MKSKRLNILYLCADRGIPIDGTKGASAHIREFASALERAGHEVTVVTRANGPNRAFALPFRSILLPPSPSETVINSDVSSYEDKNSAAENGELHNNLFIERFLTELLPESRYDAVYERYSLFSTAGLSFAESRRLPFILEINAPLVVEALRYRKLGATQLARAVEQRLFSAADLMIAVSAQVRDYILGVTPNSCVMVVPNGVDPAKFSPDAVRAGGACIERQSCFTVGFVGNLRPWHGIEILIESFAGLLAQENDAHLLIIGDTGKIGKQIEKCCRKYKVGDQIHFTGAVPHEMIPGLLHSVDAAVAPYPELSDFYFSSLKIFEYMAAGKPIVASRIGQISEILRDGETALLIPPGDARAMTEALLGLKRDACLRSRLGESARREAESLHSWDNRIDEITSAIVGLKSKWDVNSR